MKAMVLAAGLGTRLRPLTDSRPKALAEIAGRTLLDITLARLRSFGVRDVIINVHHLAGQVVAYLRQHDNFGMHVELSREDVLLDTGGGLKKAGWFFEGNDEPFLLHNVDVVSDIDFGRMLRLHVQQGALATLAVQDRKSSRLLLFDDAGELRGRTNPDELVPRPPSAGDLHPLAFSGIHVISPRLLPMLTEDGVFSIIPAYLRLAGKGEKVVAFRADDFYWRDLGTADSLAKAAAEMRQRNLL